MGVTNRVILLLLGFGMARQHTMSMVLLFAALAAVATCNGEVYRVGGVSGWTAMNITADYYQNWASSKNFKISDTLVFGYDRIFHNVIRVTRKNFNDCNTTSPYAPQNSGNDSFLISRPGHFYFLCGILGHCEMGLRVDIRVSNGGAPRPSPSPSNSVGPSASDPPMPATKKNIASSANWFMKILGGGMIVGLLACAIYLAVLTVQNWHKDISNER